MTEWPCPSCEYVWFLERVSCRHKLYNETCYPYRVQLLSHVWLTPWPTALQASLSFTVSQSLLKLMSIESMMLSNHLILCRHLFLAFNLSQHQGLFQWIHSGQSIRTSASALVLPMNIQDGSSLGLIGLISLLSKGLSRVFLSTTFWKH